MHGETDTVTIFHSYYRESKHNNYAYIALESMACMEFVQKL